MNNSRKNSLVPEYLHDNWNTFRTQPSAKMEAFIAVLQHTLTSEEGSKTPLKLGLGRPILKEKIEVNKKSPKVIVFMTYVAQIETVQSVSGVHNCRSTLI
jgi:hypothetical protein